jgi:hypothetical protein
LVWLAAFNSGQHRTRRRVEKQTGRDDRIPNRLNLQFTKAIEAAEICGFLTAIE